MTNIVMITANDYCHSVFDGTHATPKPCPNGYKLVTSKNITNDGINTSDAYFISEQDYFEINKRSKVYQWDILFSMIGTVGNLYLEEKSDIDYAIKNIGVFSCRDEFKAKWLFYYLQSPMARNHIKRFLNGAVQKFLSLKQLRDFPILPFEKDKISIVEILSALDKKIALNKQINARLEEMAKTLYDYWFVQFDFPDANGKPYKSSGGDMVFDETLKREIPKGWEVKSLNQVADIVMGQSPDGASYNLEQEGTIFFQGSTDFDWRFPNVRQYTTSPTRFAQKGDILLSVRAPVGDLNIAPFECCIGRGLAALRSKSGNNSFLFYVMKYFKTVFERRNTEGTTFGSITKDDLHSLKLVAPADNVLEKYNEIASKYDEMIFIRSQQNHQLTQLRDFLLPMLMNGQVSVAE